MKLSITFDRLRLEEKELKNEAEKITREFLALTLALPLDRKEENRS